MVVVERPPSTRVDPRRPASTRIRIPSLFPLYSLSTYPSFYHRVLPHALGSVSLALLLPSFVGVSRAFVSGMPLSWYGSVLEASLIYIPAALAGVLMPIKATTKREVDASMQSMGLGTLR